MYPILIFDKALNYIAQIDDYEYLRWHRRWRKPHHFELRVNRYKNHADKLQAGYYIAVFRAGKYRAGIIEHMELGLSQDGKISEQWKIRGMSYGGQFTHRHALHKIKEGNGYDEQNDYAENVMRHYVNVNAISPVDNARILPNLRLAAHFFNRGQLIRTRARFQPLTQLLEDISLISGLGWETEFSLEERMFIFNVLEGRDLSPSQSVLPPVIFSPEFGNVKLLGYRYSTLDSKTVAIIGGQGEAQSRLIAEVKDGQPSGLDRREFFIDARDLETPEQLQTRGEERLAELKDELVLEVEHLPGGPFTYLEDFDLGDIVHADYPGIGSTTSRIIEVVEEITPEEGDNFKIVLGKEWPDLISIMKADRRNFETEVRR